VKGGNIGIHHSSSSKGFRLCKRLRVGMEATLSLRNEPPPTPTPLSLTYALWRKGGTKNFPSLYCFISCFRVFRSILSNKRESSDSSPLLVEPKAEVCISILSRPSLLLDHL